MDLRQRGVKVTRASGILDTLINDDRTVECLTDDFLERTRNMSAAEFSREFEKKVKAHRGFSAPLWPALRRILWPF